MTGKKIQSTDILPPDTVAEVVVKTEFLKTKAAAWLSVAAMAIGAFFLYDTDDEGIQAWATGLISLVAGAAIGFAFNSALSADK